MVKVFRRLRLVPNVLVLVALLVGDFGVLPVPPPAQASNAGPISYAYL